jgi:hypothetical protein
MGISHACFNDDVINRANLKIFDTYKFKNIQKSFS